MVGLLSPAILGQGERRCGFEKDEARGNLGYYIGPAEERSLEGRWHCGELGPLEHLQIHKGS